MGSFAGFLGSAAEGFEQARQTDLQRQFANEQNRRNQFGQLLQRLASDENVHPYTRQQALKEYLNMSQMPHNKAYKPNFEGLVAPAEAQEAAGEGPAAQFTPMPSSPLEMPGEHRATLAAQSGIFKSPEQQHRVIAGEHEAQARGTLQGQIQARREALQNIPQLSPEMQAGLTLGVPLSGLIAATGAYGQGKPIPASVAAQSGIPLPDGVDPENGWVTPQYNRSGQLVAVHPSVAPPAYAPTETSGVSFQPQASGAIAPVPYTKTTQKKVPGQEGKSAPKAQVGEPGKPVGHVKPPQALMVEPPKMPGEAPTVKTITGGSKLAPGAVSPTQYGSANVPTGATRTRSEFAVGLIPQVDRTVEMLKDPVLAKKLGALKGRYNEFIAGTLGGGLDDDPQISALRTDIGLLQTGMMVPHVGARGGVQLISKFKSLIDSGKASSAQLTASLGEMRKFLVTYANEGKLKGWGGQDVNAPVKTLSRAAVMKAARDHGVTIEEATRQAEAAGYDVQ